MEDFLHTLVFTFSKRWYVLLFLISYLGIATYHWGFKRTIKLIFLGYFIAFASEASSIRNGFPYGFYSYHDAALQGELRLAGVPVWDSLSYVFLSFSGWMMAIFIRHRWNPAQSLNQVHRSWKTVFLGAVMTLLLDVVIDPLAHQGEKWFLGQIYSYPPGGFYFDVTFANFCGWLLVAFCILAAFRLSDSLVGVPRRIESVILGVLLYSGIYFFNLGLTLWIHSWDVALASTGWGLLIAGVTFVIPKYLCKNARL